MTAVRGRARGDTLASAHSLFIIGKGFPFGEGDGIHGTGRQAISQTVTVILLEKTGFSLYQPQSAFMAGAYAQTAAVTPAFINRNDLTCHG
jgi:hypothetical protein